MDKPQPLLIGQGYCILKPLAYLLDNPATISLIGATSDINGKLEVNIIPVDENEDPDLPDDMIPDTPMDLVSTRIDFIVHIIRAYDLPKDFCRDVFCEYQFYIEKDIIRTPIMPGKNQRPEYDFRNHHTIDYCSETCVEYLLKDSVFLFLLISLDKF